jgi:hypothetical protein
VNPNDFLLFNREILTKVPFSPSRMVWYWKVQMRMTNYPGPFEQATNKTAESFHQGTSLDGTRNHRNTLRFACRSKLSTHGQQEQVVLDHLPLVRFMARRIHECLPHHVSIDDLISAGLGWISMPLTSSIRRRTSNPAATRIPDTRGRSWIVCVALTGAQETCAGKRGRMRKRSRS